MSLPGTVFAAPPYTPPPVDPDFGWDPLDMSWTGANGTVFDLVSPDLGLIVGRGIRGLGNPSFTHFRDESPALAGSRWRGYNTSARTVNWPLRLFHDDGTEAFVERWNAFWDTLKPHAVGTWTVRSSKGVRRLRCRYEKGGEEAMDMDPTFFGWAPVALELTAESPFWEGDVIPQQWDAGTARDFFDPAGSPSFWISDTSTIGSAVISNPGDEPAWPRWTFYGPFTSISVAYAGQRITAPISIPAGKALLIDTDPEVMSVVDTDGVDRWSQLSSWGFSPIADGVDLPFTITMAGGGSVRAEITPRYWRAF